MADGEMETGVGNGQAASGEAETGVGNGQAASGEAETGRRLMEGRETPG